DVRHGPAAGALMARLQDDAPRVRFFATEALGRLAHRPAVPAILAMLEANNDAAVYLRHAGTLALARSGDVESVAALAGHPSRALRIAGVVVLRRLKRPEVARFLADTDLFVVTEAARAINDDGGIPAALPALAEMLDGWRRGSEPLMRRII